MASSNLDRRLVILGLILLGLLIVVPMLGVGLMGPAHMGGGMWGGGMWGDGMWGSGGAIPVWAFLFAVVSQLAFLGLLAIGAYLLYRAVTGTRSDPALEELRLAYARGELTDEEFEQRRDALEREDYQS